MYMNQEKHYFYVNEYIVDNILYWVKDNNKKQYYPVPFKQQHEILEDRKTTQKIQPTYLRTYFIPPYIVDKILSCEILKNTISGNNEKKKKLGFFPRLWKTNTNTQTNTQNIPHISNDQLSQAYETIMSFITNIMKDSVNYKFELMLILPIEFNDKSVIKDNIFLVYDGSKQLLYDNKNNVVKNSVDIEFNQKYTFDPFELPKRVAKTKLLFVLGFNCNNNNNNNDEEEFIGKIINRGDFDIKYVCDTKLRQYTNIIIHKVCHMPPSANNPEVKSLIISINEFLNKGIEVLLVGFSYGGGIVCRVAQELNKQSIQLNENGKIKNLQVVTFGSIYISKEEDINKIDMVQYLYNGDWILGWNCIENHIQDFETSVPFKEEKQSNKNITWIKHNLTDPYDIHLQYFYYLQFLYLKKNVHFQTWNIPQTTFQNLSKSSSSQSSIINESQTINHIPTQDSHSSTSGISTSYIQLQRISSSSKRSSTKSQKNSSSSSKRSSTKPQRNSSSSKLNSLRKQII